MSPKHAWKRASLFNSCSHILLHQCESAFFSALQRLHQQLDEVGIEQKSDASWTAIRSIGESAYLEIMAKEEVSTAALPMPLTTRSAKQTHRKDVGVFRKITKLKDAAETAQMTWPASSSVFLCTSLHEKRCAVQTVASGCVRSVCNSAPCLH